MQLPFYIILVSFLLLPSCEPQNNNRGSQWGRQREVDGDSGWEYGGNGRYEGQLNRNRNRFGKSDGGGNGYFNFGGRQAKFLSQNKSSSQTNKKQTQNKNKYQNQNKNKIQDLPSQDILGSYLVSQMNVYKPTKPSQRTFIVIEDYKVFVIGCNSFQSDLSYNKRTHSWSSKMFVALENSCLIHEDRSVTEVLRSARRVDKTKDVISFMDDKKTLRLKATKCDDDQVEMDEPQDPDDFSIKGGRVNKGKKSEQKMGNSKWNTDNAEQQEDVQQYQQQSQSSDSQQQQQQYYQQQQQQESEQSSDEEVQVDDEEAIDFDDGEDSDDSMEEEDEEESEGDGDRDYKQEQADGNN